MKKPAISTIEFTNHCNFSCSYCQRYHDDGKRKNGMLDLKLVKLMIDRGDFENTTYIEFQQNGEPTLHPKFTELVKLIKSAVPYVGLSTNGTYHKFKNNSIEGMALCDSVTISIHPETTQEDLDFTVNHLVNNGVKLRIQTIGKKPYGLNIEKYKDFDGVMLDDYEFREYGKVYKPKFCIDVKTSVTVQWDGDVVPCCNTVGKQKVLGNLFEESIESIWSRSDKKMFSYCSSCNSPSPFANRLKFFSETLNS